ncbi:hypothetical protein PRIPAC_95729 [Pristionchus pacificus]|uniref:Uncharacterized protein n=1 Tax=Pristionchus pacificus TaxID=54126 RepID=A0A454XVF0_PRIPA|nr:hypothetical protein PRIPAC_95729 [Pristionchus pacificus]|eukprot:PDM63790.1 hypothetical protein PRIPAC_49763 [Pristionchus pacificus]
MMIRYILFFLFCYIFCASAHPVNGEVGAAENEPQKVPAASNGKKSRDMPDCIERPFDILCGGPLGRRRKRTIPGRIVEMQSGPHISARMKRQQRHDSMRKRRSMADRPKESFAFQDHITAIPSI